MLLCNVIQFGSTETHKCLMCQVKNRSGKVFEDGVKKSFEDTVCVIEFVCNSQMRMKRMSGHGVTPRCGAEGRIFTLPSTVLLLI